VDNIVIFTNRIHEGFLKGSSTIAIFLDIASAFDNVIPTILFDDLREIGLPARLCKFVENLLSEPNLLNNKWNSTTSTYLQKGNPSGIHPQPNFIQHLPPENFFLPPSRHSNPSICRRHCSLFQLIECHLGPGFSFYLLRSSLFIFAFTRIGFGTS